jgi:outer membrane protein assembly factor BamE (lipoprotein component of BamABCDE complex)
MNPLRLKRTCSYSVAAVFMYFTAICANGCIPVFLPIPAPPHGVRMITEDTVEPLKPGQSTRADVLHLLGDPLERREDDRFFVYGWGITWAYTYSALFVLVPKAPPIIESFDPVSERRGLIIEFTPDNRFRRSQFIKYDDWSVTLEQWKKEED